MNCSIWPTHQDNSNKMSTSGAIMRMRCVLMARITEYHQKPKNGRQKNGADNQRQPQLSTMFLYLITYLISALLLL